MACWVTLKKNFVFYFCLSSKPYWRYVVFAKPSHAATLPRQCCVGPLLPASVCAIPTSRSKRRQRTFYEAAKSQKDCLGDYHCDGYHQPALCCTIAHRA